MPHGQLRRRFRLRRVRRPLLALVVLVLALGVGYGVKAARGAVPPPVPAGAVTSR